MTTRAKRMRKALESLGWDCSDKYEDRFCVNCNKRAMYTDALFCSHCGTKLPRVKTETDGATAKQLEAAIAYALGETRTVPGGDSA